jgi:UDP-glucose 4-epimerase
MKVFGDDYNTKDGSCVRDYIHIMDLAAAHTKAIKRALEKESSQIEIYNLGSGSGYSVLEVINAFEKTSKIKLNYEIASRRPGDVEAIYSDYQLAKKQLHWQPKYDIEDIMKTAWAWEQKRSEVK